MDPYRRPLLGRHAQRIKVVVINKNQVADAARTEGRDRARHPWENTSRESWRNLDVGACATRLAAPGGLGPVKTVVV